MGRRGGAFGRHGHGRHYKRRPAPKKVAATVPPGKKPEKNRRIPAGHRQIGCLGPAPLATIRAESRPTMFFARFLAILVGAHVASAATVAHAAPKDSTAYLQLANITAVAGSESGQRGTVPVTVVLHVATVAAANEICRNVPAVRAAIMSTSSRTPIPFAKGKFDSDAVSNVIAGEIEAATRVKGIIRAGFIYGSPKHSADTATDVVDPGDVTSQNRTVKS